MRRLVLHGAFLGTLAMISVALAPNRGELKAQGTGQKGQASPDFTVVSCSATNINTPIGGQSHVWNAGQGTWVYTFTNPIGWDCSIGNYDACEIFINVDYAKSNGANGPWTALSSSCMPLNIYPCGSINNSATITVTYPNSGQLTAMTYYKVERSMAIATPATVGGSCSANNVLYNPPFATDIVLVPPNQ